MKRKRNTEFDESANTEASIEDAYRRGVHQAFALLGFFSGRDRRRYWRRVAAGHQQGQGHQRFIESGAVPLRLSIQGHQSGVGTQASA